MIYAIMPYKLYAAIALPGTSDAGRLVLPMFYIVQFSIGYKGPTFGVVF